MKRHTFAMRIHTGAFNTYRKKLGEIWPSLTALLDRNHIQNFSIWNINDLIFGYCELPDDYVLLEDDAQQKADLIHSMEDTFAWISDPEQCMEMMYHDFGIVRANKELIRHRVLLTKLKNNCKQEYKRRHDELVTQRGDAITPGPDSNFSIWSAGGYIFGYNEIDTTMEQEQTAEDLAGTIEWETRQLEIMDWITNDMDWLTGEHHPNIQRIAWHL